MVGDLVSVAAPFGRRTTLVSRFTDDAKLETGTQTHRVGLRASKRALLFSPLSELQLKGCFVFFF